MFEERGRNLWCARITMYPLPEIRTFTLEQIAQTRKMGILGAGAALNPNTLKCGRLGWEIVNIWNMCLTPQHGNNRCTERARRDTTCPVPTSQCMYGACVSWRARSVLLSFSPQVLFVAHQRSTQTTSIHSFSVVRGRGKQRPSRSGGPCQAWRPTATSPKP